MNKLYKIDWNKFKVKNTNATQAFEDLSYILFCRKFNLNAGIFRYKNQTGIETEPIKKGKNIIGFQAKWFDFKIDAKQIEKSLEKAKTKNHKLTKILLYTNQEFSESSQKETKDAKTKKDIDKKAKELNIKIEWIVPSNLEILLLQPSNIDLAQLYFGLGNELNFITDSIKQSTITLLQSKEYIPLPFCNEESMDNIIKKTISKNKKICLITGHPGSGKSIIMHKIFQLLSGLTNSSKKNIPYTLKNHKSIPMLINLKDCDNETLENIIRNRQDDYNIKNKQLSYIYILDGLDELDSAKAESLFSCLNQLHNRKNTKQVIISCRTGNLNRSKLKLYLEDKNIYEYRIKNLSLSHINQFFNGKNNSSKKASLQKIKKQNEKLILEIKDIILVTLLWDTIETLNKNSTIIDLLEKKITILINDKKYKKNITSLNLPSPQSAEIINLNIVIAKKLQEKFQFRITQKQIQDIISEKYPRIDYKAINSIMEYITSLFFETSPSSYQDNISYIYQHRSYQDFFFSLYIAQEYEKNIKTLRKTQIISNEKFFQNIFISYKTKEYYKKRDIPGNTEINLLNTYLNDKYNLINENNSSELFYAIAIQKEYIFEKLLNDENLNIKKDFFYDTNPLEQKLVEWNKNKKNWKLEDTLSNLYSYHIAEWMHHVVILWRFRKYKEARKLEKIINKTIALLEKYNFIDYLKNESMPYQKPFPSRITDHFFYALFIKKETTKHILINRARPLQEKNKNNYNAINYIKSFFDFILTYSQSDIYKVVDMINDKEMLLLLDSLMSVQHLPKFLRNKRLRSMINRKINITCHQSASFLFYKKEFKIAFTQKEKEFVDYELKEFKKNTRRTDLNYPNIAIYIAIYSHLSNKHSFENLKKTQELYNFPQYSESDLYTALFIEYIQLLKNKTTISNIAQKHLNFINSYKHKTRARFFDYLISTLWAYIFAQEKNNLITLKNIKEILIKKENNINPLTFYLRIKKITPNLFKQLINESEIQVFENELTSWSNDYQTYIEQCSNLSILYTDINQDKTITYIMKSIMDGKIRHGWRKDHIVSELLIDSLELFWKNNWFPLEKLKETTQKVFDLSYRVTEITDGKGTWHGPYNVIELVSKHDINFAINLKDQLSKKEGYRNINNRAITSIIEGKINRGYPIENIYEDINQYVTDYNYEGKPFETIYEEKFKTYMNITTADFYQQKDKYEAFEKAYSTVEELKNNYNNYSFDTHDFKDTKDIYAELCIKHKKPQNISYLKEDKAIHYIREVKLSEKDFVKELRKATTKNKLQAIYKKLNNYKNNTTLKEPSSWKALIYKTYAIDNNIQRFIDFLKKSYFLQYDYYNNHSKYMHMGVAFALDNMETKEEMTDALFTLKIDRSAFFDLIKVYETLENKEMCIELFKRYLRFCDFLIN